MVMFNILGLFRKQEDIQCELEVLSENELKVIKVERDLLTSKSLESIPKEYHRYN